MQNNHFEAPIFQKYLNFISKISSEMKRDDVWLASYLRSKNRFSEINVSLLRLLLGEKISISWIKLFDNILRTFAHLCREMYRSFVVQTKGRNSLKTNSERLKNVESINLLNTFSYPKNFGKHFDDDFFVNLKDSFSKNGDTIITIYQPLNGFWKGQHVEYYDDLVFPYHMFLRPIDFLTSILKIFFSPYFKSENMGDFPLPYSDFKKIYLIDRLSPSTLHSLLFAASVSRLCIRFGIKKYIYIYEGNFWESVALKYLKRLGVYTIGYQHNVICPAALNYFPGKNESSSIPLPDLLLTTGPYTLALLKKYGDYGSTEIKSAGAIRYQYLENFKSEPRFPLKKSILVALEGTEKSICLLFYLIKYKNSFDEWKIRIRCHPAVNFNEFAKFLPKNLPENWEVSENKNLKDDIFDAGLVFYWGSTVALESICFGVPVLNLVLAEQVLNPDPLSDLKHFKWNLMDNTDPIITLENLIKMEDFDLIDQWRKALVFVESYLEPPTVKSLQSFQ